MGGDSEVGGPEMEGPGSGEHNEIEEGGGGPKGWDLGILGGDLGFFALLFLNGADLSSALLLGASVEGQLLRDK